MHQLSRRENGSALIGNRVELIRISEMILSIDKIIPEEKTARAGLLPTTGCNYELVIQEAER